MAGAGRLADWIECSALFGQKPTVSKTDVTDELVDSGVLQPRGAQTPEMRPSESCRRSSSRLAQVRTNAQQWIICLPVPTQSNDSAKAPRGLDSFGRVRVLAAGQHESACAMVG